jgi:hypothetical protein
VLVLMFVNLWQMLRDRTRKSKKVFQVYSHKLMAMACAFSGVANVCYCFMPSIIAMQVGNLLTRLDQTLLLGVVLVFMMVSLFSAQQIQR